MPSYLTLFRTHVWDESVAELAGRARQRCKSGEFMIAADETKQRLSVGDFEKRSHTDDVEALGLAAAPAGGVLWWNADYVLFMARRQFPARDYYIMLEHDVFIDCDLDRMIAHCAAQQIDLLAHDFKPISSGNPWFTSISDMTLQPWWAFIPFIVVSARAIDALLEVRQAISEQWRSGRLRHWPHCETFIATVMGQRPDMTVADLHDVADTTLHRYRPPLSARDPRLARRNIIAHPVLSGRRFVEAFAAHEPAGAHRMNDGSLRPELRHEDEADIRAVFGEGICGPRRDRAAALNGLIDLARGRPAAQSSRSQWSTGATFEEDARRANADALAEDYAFHTDLDRDPWWQVDLLGDCRVEAVEIVNSTHHPERFRQFWIESSTDGEVWSQRFAKRDDRPVSDDPRQPARFAMPQPFVARFVRVVQSGTGFMHLRRVRVLGSFAS